jgi:hypothetical protein
MSHQSNEKFRKNTTHHRGLWVDCFHKLKTPVNQYSEPQYVRAPAACDIGNNRGNYALLLYTMRQLKYCERGDWLTIVIDTQPID